MGDYVGFVNQFAPMRRPCFRLIRWSDAMLLVRRYAAAEPVTRTSRARWSL
ncbi:hypothetical protein FF36_02697 [Frankia torreyi]|uniref:Uncharacterized protein n=1 Tax=Frankia torreyi TaxID=1856 RepID=A0A0D8BF71_9ACTN|nr:hypothetical protein FF36_02697 [Frankia torreyi]KQM04152.1 hypothetical protein FF86_10297 [Frankia sp. CpI1-P]